MARPERRVRQCAPRPVRRPSRRATAASTPRSGRPSPQSARPGIACPPTRGPRRDHGRHRPWRDERRGHRDRAGARRAWPTRSRKPRPARRPEPGPARRRHAPPRRLRPWPDATLRRRIADTAAMAPRGGPLGRNSPPCSFASSPTSHGTSRLTSSSSRSSATRRSTGPLDELDRRAGGEIRALAAFKELTGKRYSTTLAASGELPRRAPRDRRRGGGREDRSRGRGAGRRVRRAAARGPRGPSLAVWLDPLADRGDRRRRRGRGRVARERRGRGLVRPEVDLPRGGRVGAAEAR